ncbi:MAG: hypothetical protein KOO65_05375 [Desulfobacterales bacterium]|nr:hypothetical protein [Desulfobacterales bacterium]
MKTLIPETKISAAMEIGTPAVRARAKKEGWPYTNRSTQGGGKRFYLLTFLPDHIKAHLLDYFGLADGDD